VQLVYRLPSKIGGIEIFNVADYLDGLPFARQLLVTGARRSFAWLCWPCLAGHQCVRPPSGFYPAGCPLDETMPKSAMARRAAAAAGGQELLGPSVESVFREFSARVRGRLRWGEESIISVSSVCYGMVLL
jgi:hypothetical protein